MWQYEKEQTLLLLFYFKLTNKKENKKPGGSLQLPGILELSDISEFPPFPGKMLNTEKPAVHKQNSTTNSKHPPEA